MILRKHDFGLILCYCFVFGLMIVYQMSSVVSGGVFILLIAFSGILCLISNLRNRVNSIFLPSLLLTTIMLVNTLLGDKTNIDNLVNTLLRIALWFFVLNVGTHFSRDNANNRIVIFLAIVYSFVSLVIESKNLATDYSSVNKFYEITTIYYLLLIFPFIFCVKNNLIRIISIVLLSVLCILSFKRTVLLTLVLLLLSWIILHPKTDKKTKWFSLLIGGLLVVVFVLISNSETFSSIMQIWNYRFAGNNNTSVLGERGLTYSSVFSLMSRSNIIEWIFGHGYDTVSLSSSTGFSAHNDFLEILYDYGILALGLYIWVILSLIKSFINSRKNQKTIEEQNEDINSINSFALFSSIVIVVFAGMFSHLITYPTHFMLISLFWGWILPKNTILHKLER